MNIPIIPVDEETIADLIDVLEWAEKVFAKPAPTPADRQGFEPFEYTERS